MAVGQTKVKFIGGCLDGQMFDSFDTRSMMKEIAQFNGYWYRMSNDSQLQLVKSDRIDNTWRNYSVDVYEKEPKGNDGYFVYRFRRKDMVSRCTALTNKGTLCKHSACAKIAFCSTHKNLIPSVDP